MQIGLMESDFRNLTAEVLANLDHPIKSYVFVILWINFLYASLSGDALLEYVMSR